MDGRIIEGLSDEDRQRLRAAINEIWHAEKVERRRHAMLEANLAYREALQREVGRLEASAEIKAIMLNILKLRFSEEGQVSDGSEGGAADGPVAPPLSREERAILKAARTQAEANAAVVAAKGKLAGAVTTRERAAASAHYRRVMRRAMEEADKRVKPILSQRDRHPRHRPTDRPEGGKPRNAPRDR